MKNWVLALLEGNHQVLLPERPAFFDLECSHHVHGKVFLGTCEVLDVVAHQQRIDFLEVPILVLIEAVVEIARLKAAIARSIRTGKLLASDGAFRVR